jgi:hypothetical protein
LDDFTRCPVLGNRWHLEHLRQHELGRAVVGVLFKQLIQYLVGLWTVLLKEVLALMTEPLSPSEPVKPSETISLC